MRLLEREVALGEIDRRLDDAAAGRGALLAVTGPMGVGKTRLAEAVGECAAARGFVSCTARGHELEQDIPFGVLRQLLERALFDISSAERARLLAGAASGAAAILSDEADGSDPDQGPVRQALYRLAANVAARAPLALIVDDAQWSDPSSLRWLHYLARRSGNLMVLIVVLSGSHEETVATPLVDALRVLEIANTLDLAPLSETAARCLLSDVFARVDDRFAEACLAATGGNPFLLGELIKQIAVEGLEPEADAAEQVATLVSPAVIEAVLPRIRRIGADALGVARAAAVLDDGGRLDQVAALAGVPDAEAAAQCDLLRRAGILARTGEVGFVYPLAAAAVRQDLAAGTRSLLQVRAARLMADSGAPAHRVARHLLASAPAGDAWVVDQLREAARQAIAGGSPGAAVGYLERASLEPPAAHLEGRVRYEWGAAAMLVDPRAAVSQFVLARQKALDGRVRCAATLGLAKAFAHCDRIGETVRVLEDSAAAVGDCACLSRFRAEQALWSGWKTGLRQAQPPAPIELSTDPASCGDCQGRRAALAGHAWTSMARGDSAQSVSRLAGLALADGPGWAGVGFDIEPLCVIGHVLMCCDRTREASALFDAGLAQFAKTGWRGAHRPLVLALRAESGYRCGDLVGAEAHARAALLAADEFGSDALAWRSSAATLVRILVARGKLAAAAGFAARVGLGERGPQDEGTSDGLSAHGALRLAQGRFAEAGADLRAAGRIFEERGCTNPSVDAWRMHLALAARVEAPDEASAIASETLRRAREFGAPWALGQALCVLGRITPGTAGLDLLEEAVGVLSHSAARYEYAGALVHFGAALRRTNRREAAREILCTGLDIAGRCGADGLAQLARQEIAATGARPRRTRHTDPAALTPRERRVAALAATGLGNAEIARLLCITRKTVEKHLSNTYTKLDIHSRGDLARALAMSAD